MKTILKFSTAIILLAVLALSCHKNNADLMPEPVNQAPNAFNLKGVTNGASGVDLLPKFTWNAATDPDGDAVTYNLYMDSNENPTRVVAENLTATEYQITDNLPPVTQYYWKVIAKDTKGNTTTSNDTYNFTTRNLNSTLITNSPGFGKRYNHTSVVFNDKLWVISGSDGGRKGDVWSSPDGENWTLERESNSQPPGGPFLRTGHASIVFDNKIWIIGGYSGTRQNDVWSSVDGINWQRKVLHANFSPRNLHTATVFKNKMWVIGGLDNNNVTAIFNSTDGVQWTPVDTPPALEGRFGHTATVFNDKLWVIGGVTASNGVYKNDIWFTEDGVNWTEATAHADFSERKFHTTIVYDNKLWMIGGIDSNNAIKDDIWYSSNGSTWAQADSSAPFGKLFAHTSVSFKNKLWLIGGSYGGNTLIRDSVWAID